MITNVRLLSPMQLPEAEHVQLMFPERACAGPMSGAGLELLADGYSKKAREIFDRLNLALAPAKR